MAATSKNIFRDIVRPLEQHILRMAYAKSMHTVFAAGASGQPTKEKLETIQGNWLVWIAAKHKSLENIAVTLGFEKKEKFADEMVSAPANFAGHKFKATVEDDLINKGFHLGSKVWTTVRTSNMFGPPKKRQKKDIVKGSTSFVKGIADGKVVLEFTLGVDGKPYSSDVAIDAKNLTLTDPAKDKEAKAAKIPKHLKGYEFLLPESDEEEAKDKPDLDALRIVTGWEKRVCNSDSDTESAIRNMMATVSFVLGQIRAKVPDYTSDDFTIVKREDEFEVWTRRTFKANSIIFVPNTTEIKDACCC